VPSHRISATDPSWPLGLADLPKPPTSLELYGEWPRERPTLAIVGTRQPTTDAADIAYRIARELAQAGVLIVSGGAYGIDAAAHEGALDGGGVTVAILGTPLDPPYPRDHAGLFGRIALRGAVVSEVRPGDAVRKASFLQRNRLIAACADACLVVQAPHKSGALSTAATARALQRPLYACPWSPLEAQGAGTVRLLVDGHASAIRDAVDIAARMDVKLAAQAPIPKAEPTGVAARVLAHLGRDLVTFVSLADALGVPVPELQGVLLELVLAGEIEPRGASYRRTRSA
jgi:DNA processing protein